MYKVPPSGNQKRKTLIFSALRISIRPHEQGEHIVEEILGVRLVVREIWALFVLLGRPCVSYLGTLHNV